MSRWYQDDPYRISSEEERELEARALEGAENPRVADDCGPFHHYRAWGYCPFCQRSLPRSPSTSSEGAS